MDPNSDKSSRSVFVGNIPYEATEERLKDIFSEVGPVVSFKLVYDRDNGKPKGYGFCEIPVTIIIYAFQYNDALTAQSAMRNLSNYEIGGRTLRVDSASSEKNRMEMQSMMGGAGGAGPQSMLSSGGGGGGDGGGGGGSSSSPYGEPVDPEKAPESISKAVASLPPENMFELMKQMKACIQNNPQEARIMLNQNPQLAYALLQAQVVMRIVDPELAVTMLHKAPPRSSMPYPVSQQQQQQPMPKMLEAQMGPIPVPSPQQQAPFMPMGMMMGGGPPQRPGQMMEGPPPQAPFGREAVPFQEARPAMRDPREERYGRDPRSRDPRGGGGGAPSGGNYGGGPSRNPPNQLPPPVNRNALPPGLPPHLAGADPEKAQLIMQVLKLTDEQIAMLPADQRESIMHLKKQINAIPN